MQKGATRNKGVGGGFGTGAPLELLVFFVCLFRGFHPRPLTVALFGLGENREGGGVFGVMMV